MRERLRQSSGVRSLIRLKSAERQLYVFTCALRCVPNCDGNPRFPRDFRCGENRFHALQYDWPLPWSNRCM